MTGKVGCLLESAAVGLSLDSPTTCSHAPPQHAMNRVFNLKPFLCYYSTLCIQVPGLLQNQCVCRQSHT